MSPVFLCGAGYEHQRCEHCTTYVTALDMDKPLGAVEDAVSMLAQRAIPLKAV